MKKIIIIVAAALLAATLLTFAIGSAENASLTAQYIPQGATYVGTERDDGFTEYHYRDADGGRYTLTADRNDVARALEYESGVRSTADSVALTETEAFDVILAQRPGAQLITAVEDREDGRWVWDILFSDGTELGFYELDAATGAVLDYDIFYGNGTVINPVDVLSARVGNPSIVEISLGTDDGRLEIDGEASTDMGYVEFTIDADTGVIVELENEDWDD